MANPENQGYHSKDVMEFVTVGMEFCKRLEIANTCERKAFVDTMLKILPLLYIKAQIALNFESDEEFYTEHIVSEADYNAIQSNVSGVMGEYDDYLDVFVDDMKYSDEPIRCTVSESLADIYQELKNLAANYQTDNDIVRNDALLLCLQNFREHWGQKLLNALRALHLLWLDYQQKQNDTEDNLQ